MIKAPNKANTTKNSLILKQRIKLFSEFSIELIKRVNDTYPGSEGIDNNDMLNHYNWCFDVNSNVFMKQGVNFKNNIEVRDYFLDILIKSYYNIDDKQKDIACISIIKSLNILFSTNITDSNNISILSSIFKKFNKSIDKAIAI